jgi:hypothetical protein
VNEYAVNPQTGEVAEFDGQAWKPLDKKRVAKNAAGDLSVFDGQTWKPIKTGSPLAPAKIQAQEFDQAQAYNPTFMERMKDLFVNDRAGTAPPSLPEDAGLGLKALDLVQSGKTAVDTMARGVTGGLTDEAAGLGAGLAAVLPGSANPGTFTEGFNRGSTAVNQNIDRFKGENPVTGSLLEGTGMVTSPLFRLGQGWQQAGKTAGSRALRGGLLGAGYGAEAGAAYNEGDIGDRANAAGFGAAIGGPLGFALPLMIEGGTKGAQTFAQANAAKKAAATTGELKKQASQYYKDAAAADLIIAPKPIQDLNKSIVDDLANFGFHPELQPKVGVILKELERVQNGNITATGLDNIRKMAVGITKSPDASERALGGMVVGKIDDLMESLTAADVVQGNAAKATEALQKGHAAWKTMRKSELIDDLVTKGENQAMSTNSGGNVQNAIRQKLRSILDDPKKARLFTAEERGAIDKIVKGTASQNALRMLGRLAPSSNAWLGILSTFAAPGIGVAVPLAGAAAKAGATKLTNNAVENLSTLVRGGAPSAGGPSAIQQFRNGLLQLQKRKQLGLLGTAPSAPAGALLGESY